MKTHYFCLLIWLVVANMFLFNDSTANNDSTKGNNSIYNSDDSIKSSNGNIYNNNSDDIDESTSGNNGNNKSTYVGGNDSSANKRSPQNRGILITNHCSCDCSPFICYLVNHFLFRRKEDCDKSRSNDYKRIKRSFKGNEDFIPPFWNPYCVKWYVSGREVRLCSLGYTKIK